MGSGQGRGWEAAPVPDGIPANPAAPKLGLLVFSIIFGRPPVANSNSPEEMSEETWNNFKDSVFTNTF